MPNRRNFIKTTILGTATAIVGFPAIAVATTQNVPKFIPKKFEPFSPSKTISEPPKFYSPLHTSTIWGHIMGLMRSQDLNII